MRSTFSLLEGMARRLAADEPVSRRGLLPGRGASEPSAAARTAADAARLEEDEHRSLQGTAAHPATHDDLVAMRAVLARTAPTRAEMLGLIASLRTPDANGRLGDPAFTRIAALRKKLRAAHAEVASVKHRSDVRARLLSFLSDTDALIATLAQLGHAPGKARVDVLRAQAQALEKRAAATHRTIAPALTPQKASAKP